MSSDEWVLVKPELADGCIQGDTLIVQSKTDIDNIVVKWGKESVNEHGRILMTAKPGGPTLINFTAFMLLNYQDSPIPGQDEVLRLVSAKELVISKD